VKQKSNYNKTIAS